MFDDSSEGPPDALSAVLHDLRLASGSYGRCELARPWGIDFAPQRLARFHLVVSGECHLHVPGEPWVALRPGDIVLLPHGKEHALAHAPRGRTKPLESFPLEEFGDGAYHLRKDGTGARTLLVCCSVAFEGPAAHPLLDLMPPLLHLRRGAVADPVLPTLLDAMGAEVSESRIGAAALITRLADVLILRVVRAWIEAKRADTTGWLAAIRDPSIGRALVAMHRRPGEPWSVDSLAAVARVSRSVFAERFTGTVGVSPARYLVRLRMHLASLWLENERVSVAEAAARVGYDSEASFSRAFKRTMGRPPSVLRRA